MTALFGSKFPAGQLIIMCWNTMQGSPPGALRKTQLGSKSLSLWYKARHVPVPTQFSQPPGHMKWYRGQIEQGRNTVVVIVVVAVVRVDVVETVDVVKVVEVVVMVVTVVPSGTVVVIVRVLVVVAPVTVVTVEVVGMVVVEVVMVV